MWCMHSFVHAHSQSRVKRVLKRHGTVACSIEHNREIKLRSNDSLNFHTSHRGMQTWLASSIRLVSVCIGCGHIFGEATKVAWASRLVPNHSIASRPIRSLACCQAACFVRVSILSFIPGTAQREIGIVQPCATDCITTTNWPYADITVLLVPNACNAAAIDEHTRQHSIGTVADRDEGTVAPKLSPVYCVSDRLLALEAGTPMAYADSSG